MQCAKFKSESGSAVLEFVGFGLLFQIPMLLFVMSIISLQHDQLAAEAITRDVLRSYVLLNSDPAARALDIAANYKVSPSRLQVTLSCDTQDCLEEGAWVSVKTKVGRAFATGTLQR